MRAPLTPAQKEVFQFVSEFWEIEERCPSLREICVGKIGDRQVITPRAARDTAHFHMKNLVSKNYLVEDCWMNQTFWRVAPMSKSGALA